MDYGFVRVGAAIPRTRVADCKYNATEIVKIIEEAVKENTEILLFPELCLTSCSCGDLYRHSTLLKGAETALQTLLDATSGKETIVVAGIPATAKGAMLNCAIVIWKGEIMGVVPQNIIPNSGESSQKRWFTTPKKLPAGNNINILGKEYGTSADKIFRTPRFTFAIEFGSELLSPTPQSTKLSMLGAEIILCMASDCETVGSRKYIKGQIQAQSARCNCGYMYSSCGYGESSGDAVFAGNAFIYENGGLLEESKRFSIEGQLLTTEIDVEKLRHDRIRNSTFADSCKAYSAHPFCTIAIEQKISPTTSLKRRFTPNPFIPVGEEQEERCNEIFNIQAAGLAKRIEHTHAATCVIGISGGLDSTLALLVTAKAFDILDKERSGIIAITMPGFGTTDRTYNNALKLMQSLGVTIEEISIKPACIQHFKDIGHDIGKHDVTYENSQARERTQILMDMANRLNGLVVGTGDLSELALGWATYNGDHMSMYGVNAAVPKTLIQYIVRQIAESSNDDTIRATLLDIVDTPISPELTPADDKGNIKQKTEDLVGPYELHDFFLYHTLHNAYSPGKIYMIARDSFGERYADETIKKWLTTFCRRFFTQQFKRSCMPDGPKIGSCGLSPRGEWKMATDTAYTLWIDECESLQ